MVIYTIAWLHIFGTEKEKWRETCLQSENHPAINEHPTFSQYQIILASLNGYGKRLP
ncbi:hypothetical protein [Acetobacter sp. KSO5]|uniref:hypothetical protein n=1 Tax=Acetobacter sp. KSO5 TaxID=3373674 RepID=UPI00376F2EF4